MIGKTLGYYEITGQLGKGGMGEVYRARDTKLNRDVALKVLPSEFANDAERMGRFKREAQLLASLNHTNIAAIYGLEECEGVRALVMELAEGPTLADRIVGAPGRAPVQFDEALAIARKTSERRNDSFVPGSPAERIALVWPLTREVVSLNKRQDAERRLQRHVAILGRREG
jgi:hypothetical protein